MFFPSSKYNWQRGNTATPILVFFGIVTMTVLFFFIFTFPNWKKRTRETTGAANKESPAARGAPGQPGSGPTDGESGRTSAAESESAPGPGNLKEFYPKPEALFTAVSNKLLNAGPAGLAEFLGDEALPPPKREALTQLFDKAGIEVSKEKPWSEIGQVGTAQRWALNIYQGAQTPDNLPRACFPLAINFEADIASGQGYTISKVSFPRALLPLLGPSFDTSAISEPPDSLEISHDFLHSLLGRNFQEARTMTDAAKLTHEKLAGLCIIFEEGKYRVANKKPLSVTYTKGDTAWTIVSVHSDKEQTDLKFGLEMRRSPAGDWKVEGMNFNDLLATYVQQTESGSVHYTPVVPSPAGGESLVLYFEYDKAQLTERAARQLGIVAELLKSDPARKMQVSGYADALGESDYNVRLSKARAETVSTTLRNLGVDTKQIVTVGMGESSPLAPNETPTGTDDPLGRSRNRRTEIFLDF